MEFSGMKDLSVPPTLPSCVEGKGGKEKEKEKEGGEREGLV